MASSAYLHQAKTLFFTGISHELRSPLTLISGPARDSLAEADLPAKYKQRFSLISRASGRLLRLVNSILDYTSVEAGRAQVSFRAVNLFSYTEDLASLFRSAIERNKVRYIVRCKPPAGAKSIGYTDVAAYEKIVFNLISNAQKYTISGTIEVTLGMEGDTFALTVKDSGIGIPEDEMGKIFKRFHRVNNSQARNIEGTGIGLAYVLRWSLLITIVRRADL